MSRELPVPRSAISAIPIIIGICLLVAGCMSPTAEPPHASIAVTTTMPTHAAPPAREAAGYPQLGGTEVGSLVEAKPFTLIDPRITMSSGGSAWRIRYITESALEGKPVEVTGVVLVPGGEPPSNGWDVIAFNHGNTGITQNCGPSLYNDMLNQWQTISVLLMYGYAVVAMDYEGLGGSGTHSFLNASALGRNVIDGVRAVRHLRPDISNRWAAFGGSLGGLATWAANEEASTYGKGLDLVGAAAWVPVVDASGLPGKAAAGTLSLDQVHLYFLAIMGLERSSHPDIDLRRFMRGTLYDNRELLLTCTGPDVEKALAVTRAANPADLKPIDRAAQDEMAGWLADIAVPQQPTAAPMLVIYGGQDKLVDQAWIERAIKRGCAMGDVIQWVLRDGDGHADIDASMALPWIRERFDNQAPINRCVTDPLRP